MVGNGRNGIEEELREWESGEWKKRDRSGTRKWDSGEWKERDRRGIEGME
jgi:hypothetical protein